MKNKMMLLTVAALVVFAAPQANACTDMELSGGLDFLMVVTSAPTITTVAAAGACRDEILNAKEAAVEYRMSGKMSPVLQSSIDAVQKEQNLSAETIIDRLISVKLGAE